MPTHTLANPDPSKLARTFVELLALESAALDLALDNDLAVAADQCALRSVLAAKELRAALLAAAAEATGITVPLDQYPELTDLLVLEVEYGTAGFSSGSSAIMTALLDG